MGEEEVYFSGVALGFVLGFAVCFVVMVLIT